MTTLTRPAGSPSCWGYQYEDGNPECYQCSFKESCRPIVLGKYTAQPTQSPTRLPVVYSTQLPAPIPPPQPQGIFSPSFRPPSFPSPMAMSPPPPPGPSPQYRPFFTPSTVQQVFQQPYQPVPQPQATWPMPVPSVPDPRLPPNPLEPLMRPGTMGPPYYFTQYPNETVPGRLAKNMLLRGLEAIFRELANFFGNFTWPKR